MIDVREAPVPVRGWFWPEGLSHSKFVRSVQSGWPASLDGAVSDINGLLLTHEEQAIGFLLSNGQTVIVRAKK